MSVCVEITYIFSAKISELLNNKHLLIFLWEYMYTDYYRHACVFVYLHFLYKKIVLDNIHFTSSNRVKL